MMTNLAKQMIFLVILQVVAVSCANPFPDDLLVATPVHGDPTEAEWARAVPLDLAVWMGNVHQLPEIVVLDQETSHRSTDDCHHGPSVSDPVDIRLMAVYSDSRIFVRAIWQDRTMDEDLGSWKLTRRGWMADPEIDDGIALLWTSAAEQEYRCQRSCHMVDVDVYDGGTQMRMGMRHDGDGILDLWRWRSSVTGRFGYADDMVVDGNGKRGDEGLALSVENRNSSAPGPEFHSKNTAPYFLITAPKGRQAQVLGKGSWKRGRWDVLLSRALDTGDPDDVVFQSGFDLPFSVSIFDHTWTQHHVSEGELILRLADWRPGSRTGFRDPYEPFDF